MTESLNDRRARLAQKKAALEGKAHPDYPYTMERNIYSGAFISPDIHSHRVLLWPPTKRHEGWEAQYSSHDGSFSGTLDLGAGGDAHSHMRRMWDELDPSHRLANSDLDVEQMVQGAVNHPGKTFRSREFGDAADRARGMN